MNPLLPVGLLSCFAFAACESIHSAPSGSPRIELEVVHEIDSSCGKTFGEGVEQGALEAALRAAVEPQSDVGLRFYPVATEDYGEGAERSEYVMTVRAVQMEALRRVGLHQGAQDEPARILATVEGVRCRVRVHIEKRRETGPALTVGMAEGVARAVPRKADPADALPLSKHSNEVNDTELSRAMLRRALEGAVEEALIELQRPIDRELKLLRTQG